MGWGRVRGVAVASGWCRSGGLGWVPLGRGQRAAQAAARCSSAAPGAFLQSRPGRNILFGRFEYCTAAGEAFACSLYDYQLGRSPANAMPKQRQRIVFCDCLDCQEQPASSDVAAHLSPLSEAAAKQEPPPKCLLLVACGCMQPPPEGGAGTSLDACSLPHLNKCTREGQLTLLTLRKEPSGPLAVLQQLLGGGAGQVGGLGGFLRS